MAVYVVYYIFIILFYGLVYNFDFCLKPGYAGQYKPAGSMRGKYRHDMKLFVIISISVLILILGLRSETMGIDLIKPEDTGYLQAFEKLNSYSWPEIFRMKSFLNFEKGFIIFNKLIGTVAVKRQFFLFVCAAVSLIPAGITIYKYSPMPLTSLLIYMGLPTFIILFSALRQAMAVSVTLLAFQMIRKRKKLMFVLLVLLAATLHTSAAVFLIAYPLYHMKSGNITMLAQLSALPVVWLLRKKIFMAATQVFYDVYVIDDNGAVRLLLVFVAIYIFGIVYGDRNNRAENGLLNLFWAACAIQALAGISSVAMRMGYYFFIYLILLLPEIFEDMKATSKPAQRKLIIAAAMICFVAYGYFQIKNTYWSESYPYMFFAGSGRLIY